MYLNTVIFINTHTCNQTHTHTHTHTYTYYLHIGDALIVMVTVVGIGYGDPSSNSRGGFISHGRNALLKGMNPTILFSSMSK